jgi:hypothetical protein
MTDSTTGTGICSDCAEMTLVKKFGERYFCISCAVKNRYSPEVIEEITEMSTTIKNQFSNVEDAFVEVRALSLLLERNIFGFDTSLPIENHIDYLERENKKLIRCQHVQRNGDLKVIGFLIVKDLAIVDSVFVELGK